MDVLTGIDQLLIIVALACLIVLLAMIIDLASGLQKAKERGDMCSSWGLKRTLSKFLMYEGGMLIAAGVDLLIHFSRMLLLFHLDIVCGVPLITCLVGIFLLVVEFLSVREKADQKTKKEFSRAEALAAKAINKNLLVEAFTEAISNAVLAKNNEKS